MERRRLLVLFMLSALALSSFTSGAVWSRIGDSLELEPVEYWALIVGGDDEGIDQCFVHDANYMFHILNVHYRFDGIYYLSYDTGRPGVDAKATKNSTRQAIYQWLAGKSDSNDVVFIFVSMHGGGYNSHTGQLSDDQCIDGSRNDAIDEGSEIWNNMGVDEFLNTRGDNGEYAPYWDDELKSDLSNVSYGKLCFSTLACFSGGLVDDLNATSRTVLTSANETYTSVKDTEHDGFCEWAESFMDALHGKDTYWSDEENLLKHNSTEINADSNGDGNISMWEAWNYSWWHDEARLSGYETPWLDANGNGLPTFKNGTDVSSPYEEPGDRISADAVWLPKKVEGDINNDGIVDIFDAILLANAYNSYQGSLHWDRRADLNTDGAVDVYDAISLAAHYGHSMGGGSGMSGQSGVLPDGGVEAGTAGATSIFVEPSQSTVYKGEAFNVTVKVTDVVDLAGWEFKLYWNKTVLNCTNVIIQTPTEWQNNTQNYGPGLEPNYNSTHARYFKAQSRTDPAPSFNGSMTIVTLTFQAIQPGTTSLLLQETKLGSSAAQPITHTVSSGSVSVYYGRYMRSDTHTINGLNAYKLSIPQSASSAVYSKSGSGEGASWGIRAWIRHSNGVEQEVSLDGQTGTPKAVVYRYSGSGIQSSTVSVTQTALQSTDSLVVRVYVQIAEGSWNLCATFTTEQLQSTTLTGTTWTVYYYTYAYYSYKYDTTIAKFYWGTTTYNSRIQNLRCS